MMNKQLEELDILNILSFVIGLANYEENLTQSDKQEILSEVDKTTQIAIEQLTEQLQYQNKLLEQILDIVRRTDYEEDKEIRKAD